MPGPGLGCAAAGAGTRAFLSRQTATVRLQAHLGGASESVAVSVDSSWVGSEGYWRGARVAAWVGPAPPRLYLPSAWTSICLPAHAEPVELHDQSLDPGRPRLATRKVRVRTARDIALAYT